MSDTEAFDGVSEVMETHFDFLARKVGRDRLNEYAVEHHIAKDDPGWAGAIQMIPLLDALEEQVSTVRRLTDNLPEAIREAGSTIVQGLAQDVRTQTVAGIREDMAGERKASLAEAKTYVEQVGNLLIDHAEEQTKSVQEAISRMDVHHATLVDASNNATTQARKIVGHIRDLRLLVLVVFLVGMVIGGVIGAWGYYHVRGERVACRATIARMAHGKSASEIAHYENAWCK